MDREPETEFPARQRSGSLDESGAGSSEAALACNCCRRRKLRCSREVPTCQQCRRTGTGCVYETKRAKPGIKAGAIDNLHKRLDALEKVVHRERQIDQRASQPESHSESLRGEDGNAYNILSFFAREFQRFNDVNDGSENSPGRGLKSSATPRPHKRRRLGGIRSTQETHTVINSHAVPESDEVELVLQAYFSHVHPWIPMVHESQLRRQLSRENEAQSLEVVLRAMSLVASRFIQDKHARRTLCGSDEERSRVRDDIVATAMRQLSVENAQALIMVAFDDIGSGLAQRAWTIVGALSRHVEYLQLAVEEDEAERPSFCQPYMSLPSARDWTESEERRRVFWNVFNLDRLCSVMMGWNTSLTSDDVNRRLPADGIKWRKEDQVTTPYFGIWDKAAGRIGNPIAFLPSHYAQPPPTTVDEEIQTPSESGTSPGTSQTHVDMSTVGAFAYSIEATESLSRVTSYFLQQRVNMRDQRDLGSWLTRFKELDLRLVHWKMLLPQKWKVDVSSPSTRMDPNLTLAHVTHNTSMIMLHQLIAFPLAEWPFKNRLPSLCSADTCQAAAVEIATIAENYLKNAPASVPVASQFAFCLYIAARALLLCWQSSGSRHILAPQFWSIVDSLEAMATRWVGPSVAETSTIQSNLAAKYANKARQLYERLSQRPGYRIHVMGYTKEIDHSVPGMQESSAAHIRNVSSRPESGVAADAHIEPPAHSHQPTSLRDSGLASVDVHGAGSPLATMGPPGPYQRQYQRMSLPGGDLGAISQLLLDQQFMDMDRIISYDDGIFGSEYEGAAW